MSDYAECVRPGLQHREGLAVTLVVYCLDPEGLLRRSPTVCEVFYVPGLLRGLEGSVSQA